MTPHLAEELWEMLGHSGRVVECEVAVALGRWGREGLAREDQLEIPVQINGKVRGRLSIVRDEIQDSVLAAALGDPANRRPTLNGKADRKG